MEAWVGQGAPEGLGVPSDSPHDQGAASERDCELIYTISGTASSSETSHTLHLLSELPPRYEEKETATTTSLSPSSERDSAGSGATEEGLTSRGGRNLRLPLCFAAVLTRGLAQGSAQLFTEEMK